MSQPMTQKVAEYLAASFSVPHSHAEYRARKLHGEWLVWCDASEHAVEFDQRTLDAAAAAVSTFRYDLATWNGPRLILITDLVGKRSSVPLLGIVVLPSATQTVKG